MTTPIAHDHPDWQRTSSTADIGVVNIVADVQGVINLVRTTVFVGNSNYLWVVPSVNAGGLRTQLLWRDALSGGNLVSNNTIDTLAGKDCQGPVVVQSPFLEIQTVVDAIGRAVSLKIWQVSTWGAGYTANAHNAMITQDALNINAGVSQTVAAPMVRWGWGFWNARIEDGVAGRIRLQSLDYLGATQLLHYRQVVDGGFETMLLLPPRPIQVVATNLDAAAHPLYASLHFHPGPF